MQAKNMTLGGMQFTDISMETYREYVYDSGFILRVENPQWLCIRPSGNHRLIDAQGVSHCVAMEGCKDVRFLSKGDAFVM